MLCLLAAVAAELITATADTNVAIRQTLRKLLLFIANFLIFVKLFFFILFFALQSYGILSKHIGKTSTSFTKTAIDIVKNNKGHAHLLHWSR